MCGIDDYYYEKWLHEQEKKKTAMIKRTTITGVEYTSTIQHYLQFGGMRYDVESVLHLLKQAAGFAESNDGGIFSAPDPDQHSCWSLAKVGVLTEVSYDTYKAGPQFVAMQQLVESILK